MLRNKKCPLRTFSCLTDSTTKILLRPRQNLIIKQEVIFLVVLSHLPGSLQCLLKLQDGGGQNHGWGELLNTLKVCLASEVE